jgi:chitinase
VANTCSGVEQTPGEFASIFLARRDAQRTPVAVAAMKDRSTRDDPATSPYPIWRTARAYVEGAKVVWQGGVYEARWWSMGDRPDEPVEQLWDTPWRYLGPVLDSDVVAIRSTPKVVEGNWEEWDGDDVYVAGDEVELDGQVYRASWWTQGDRPELDPDRPFDHPWEHLGEVKGPRRRDRRRRGRRSRRENVGAVSRAAPASSRSMSAECASGPP